MITLAGRRVQKAYQMGTLQMYVYIADVCVYFTDQNVDLFLHSVQSYQNQYFNFLNKFLPFFPTTKINLNMRK